MLDDYKTGRIGLKNIQIKSYCCIKPTCSSSNSPPFLQPRICGNCGAECDKCDQQFKT